MPGETFQREGCVADSVNCTRRREAQSDHVVCFFRIIRGDHKYLCFIQEQLGETQPAENKPDEQQREEIASGALLQHSSLQGLQALQLEMEPVNNQASRAFCRFKLRMKQRLRFHLEKRSTIIQGIPGFWAKTVSLTT